MTEVETNISSIGEVRFHSRKHNLVRLSGDRKRAKWLREIGTENEKKWAFTTEFIPGTIVTLRISTHSEVPENPNDSVVAYFTFIDIEPSLLTPDQLEGIDPIPNCEDDTYVMQVELAKYFDYKTFYDREANSYRIYCTTENITKKWSHRMQDFNECKKIYLMMRTSDGVELEIVSTERIE